MTSILTEMEQYLRNLAPHIKERQGAKLLSQCVSEIERLHKLLSPFAEVGRNIPENWPGEHRLRVETCQVGRSEYLAHYGEMEAWTGILPEIDAWREAAQVMKDTEGSCRRCGANRPPLADETTCRECADMEIDRLRAIVDTLPTTVDNVPIVVGQVLWYRHPKGRVYSTTVGLDLGETWMNRDCDENQVWKGFTDCYSTRKAAEEAKEE